MQSAIDAIFSYLPEVILFGGIVLLILLNLFDLNRALQLLAIATIVTHVFAPGFRADSVLHISMSAAAIMTLALSERNQRMEFYVLVIGVLLGAELLIRNAGFIMIILSMELISISSYVLTAGTEPDKKRAEAAWKFFIYGSVATAVMIFGITYHFGNANPLLYTIGSAMMIAGFLFKMTAVPFHLWAPDVYEATPAPIVAYLSVVPKLAGVGIIIHFVNDAPMFVAIAAIISMIIGTLVALSQTDARRMMAYSSVAQAGIMLAAISVSGQSVSFYVLIFTIMNYAVFILIGTQEKTAYTEFSGIAYSKPFLAIGGTLALVSLVGLPPLAGFMGKLFVFTDVWRKYSSDANFLYLGLFITGLLATVASLFFYLKIPFYMFFRRPEVSPALKISPLTNLLLAILVGLLIVLFIAPGLVDGLRY